MRSLNYSDGTVGITVTNDPVRGTISWAWSKAEFEAEFSVSIGQFDKVIYEPDRNEYLVVDINSTVVQRFSDPTEHPALNVVHTHFDFVLAKAIERIDNISNPYYGLTLPEAKKEKISQMRFAVLGYFEGNYSLDQQTLMNSLALLPSTPNDVKLDIASVLEWIKQVMYHFFLTVNAINAATSLAEFETVTWDFEQFNATKPAHTLQSLYTRVYLSEH